MLRIIHKIKWQLSECYRIRLGNGIFPIRNPREAKALYRWCQRYYNEYDNTQRKLNATKTAAVKLYAATYRHTFGDKHFAHKTNQAAVISKLRNYCRTSGENMTELEALNVYSCARRLAGWFWD